jgi:hypothetical protein
MTKQSDNPFPESKPLYKVWIGRILANLSDSKVLFEAVLVALSFHVIMFPVVWFVGWALPWPKSPVITTVIEYDLQKWLKSGKPRRIIEFRNPELNK